jgi:cellulose synthase/poly-beta-1,6-N-acetylglucosamine synthase-like glycosyltransferase
MAHPVVITLMIFIPYSLLILALTTGWLRNRETGGPGQKVKPGPFISVIVPVRNEADNLAGLIGCLLQQRYQTERWELIFVNDHSDDGTAQELEGWTGISSISMRVFHNPEGETGKKAALARGIAQARGEWIVTTDADCRMGKNWLASIAHMQEKKQPNMIFSPVVFDHGNKRFFGKFQAMEFLTLMATAAGSSNLERAVFCNAANMAFRKQAYLQLEDPLVSNVISGDDTLLLQKMKKLNPRRIVFNKSRQALVWTHPVARIRDFWQQRKRWVSKSRHYKDKDILTTGTIVFITNLWMLMLMAGAFFSPVYLKALILGFAWKFIVDMILLIPVVSYFQQHDLWKYYLPAQILYPLYSTLTALAGQAGGFNWKNRYYPIN